jgi:hypothetical protein
MSDELTSALVSLFVVALVAALAPFIVALAPRLRVPQVVVQAPGRLCCSSSCYSLSADCRHCWYIDPLFRGRSGSNLCSF